MSATDYASAIAVQSALRRIKTLRSSIASELAGAAVNAGDDQDMADDIESLQAWLSDGASPLHDALKGADHMLCAAADDEYERRTVPHPVAAE